MENKKTDFVTSLFHFLIVIAVVLLIILLENYRYDNLVKNHNESHIYLRF